MKNNFQKIILLLGIIAPIMFFILMYIIFPTLYPEYNSANQHISQLGAIDSPIRFYANFFGFYLFGVSIILFSIAIFKLPELTTGHKVSSVLLLMNGISVSLVAFFPCDVGCVPTTKTGTMHLVLAGSQLMFLMSTVVVFSLSRPLKNKTGNYIKFMFLLWLIPSAVWFSSVVFNFNGESVGFIQRISLAMTYFFVVIQGIVYSQYYKYLRLKQ